MSIKIEGLCGLTVKSGIFYALLPNFKVRVPSVVNGKYLLPHYPIILLEYDLLDDPSKSQVRYIVEKTHSENGRDITKNYGLILLDKEIVTFTPSQNTSLQYLNVSQNFIEMAKVYTDYPGYVQLDNQLLNASNITNPINGVDLACRVSINTGTLTAQEPTPDYYTFDYNDSDASYKNSQNPFHPCTILDVNVQINGITIGDRQFNFTNNSPTIWIQNLPIDAIELNDREKDHDFEIVYKLAPSITANNREKRLPTFHKVGPARPIVCALAWFQS